MERAEALAAQLLATGSAVATVAAGQDGMGAELRAQQGALERLAALVSGLQAASGAEGRFKALEARLQSDLLTLQVRPALVRAHAFALCQCLIMLWDFLDKVCKGVSC